MLGNKTEEELLKKMASIRRLQQELSKIQSNPVDGCISVGPISDDNLFQWKAIIEGPVSLTHELILIIMIENCGFILHTERNSL